MAFVQDKYDYLAIIGDLNYRIELTYEDCVATIQSKDVEKLNERDQLTLTRAEDAELAKLKEAGRKFMPTFKFDENSDVYDTSPKKRVPSYTDRVLIRRGRKRLAVGNAQGVVRDLTAPEKLNFPAIPKCVKYECGTCRFSDHRSVLGTFKFSIPIVNEKKLAEVEAVLQFSS
jgi:hypothetical protein